jgi:hypothetical protein
MHIPSPLSPGASRLGDRYLTYPERVHNYFPFVPWSLMVRTKN